MSLFRMREWWGTTPGANEEFGGGCVAVGNLDNAADGTMKIATGSFSGMLRLYAPREMNFRVEDVMLESELDAPILQLAAGHLLSDANRTALAVLHPRCLAVYSVSAVAQPGSPGSNAQYYSLTLAYEHQLERPACNMVHGAFGGTYGHELICVQSMDGLLTVIEQDRINLERKLSRFLLPGMPRSGSSNPKPTPSLAVPVSIILCVCSNPLSCGQALSPTLQRRTCCSLTPPEWRSSATNIRPTSPPEAQEAAAAPEAAVRGSCRQTGR